MSDSFLKSSVTFGVLGAGLGLVESIAETQKGGKAWAVRVGGSAAVGAVAALMNRRGDNDKERSL